MIIVDYKVGNIGSIINMLKKIGVKAKLSSDKDEIMDANKLLLPGVGSFDNGMRNLRESGLIEVLNKKVLEDKTPILGICLGMQLLMDSSEEGQEKGLGWIKGEVKKFDFGKNKDKLKVPHMGWNIVNPTNRDSLYKNFDEESRFYFVHSYHAICEDEKNILGKTHYGYNFASSIYKDNIFGVQFHPEKSHKFGMRLLKNFSEME
ncbi:imidazole glycerol phosphate synthase subunit HisH [Sulfurovum sp. bin170]|uniref:imidazole glycerol phosphate synthase subunit HisH n=1 Tax=Sulfurovum sp. bin170 TaxID=2695268 RepID=UPI0013DFCB7B|nr:imidazole glycerol phosphate synthase subunit HisH [Sulfurovum sp. bin170]NEW60730.1 imidazole glycerol phosphate synthase subunit HisH [Sulfurovum sp. bin170]